ncbi:RES family NAD+ phosphorylase [Corallincola platygyrae]|uniref:RES family NAD+ phosphorylase n=1 Tax=Corallincola platygyrae TaxID=1193278 RepID=A0ABW4XJX4_9GAMM
MKNPEELSLVSASGKLIRIVESQQQIATTHLVDDLEEQHLLEQLLEEAKPPIPEHARHLHYLLATSFRYPPLNWGSRFGTKFEPSLFYGALQATTAQAETAYYRLLFWHSMEVPPPNPIRSQHSAFTATFASDKVINLTSEPYLARQPDWTHPGNYLHTQRLGAEAREQGAEAIIYTSARDPAKGRNIALLTGQVFSETSPCSQWPMICFVDGQRVQFHSTPNQFDMPEISCYLLEAFIVEGQLPLPAQ